MPSSKLPTPSTTSRKMQEVMKIAPTAEAWMKAVPGMTREEAEKAAAAKPAPLPKVPPKPHVYRLPESLEDE